MFAVDTKPAGIYNADRITQLPMINEVSKESSDR